MRDKIKKNRQAKGKMLTAHKTPARGERHGSAKLTIKSVKKIRDLRATGQYTLKQLGEMFGVSLHTIHDITTGRHWK